MKISKHFFNVENWKLFCIIILITKLDEQFKNFKSSYRCKQKKRLKKILGKGDWFSGLRLHDFVISTKSNCFLRSGIRTHAYNSRLWPERSALDRSAILTCTWLNFVTGDWIIPSRAHLRQFCPQSRTCILDDEAKARRRDAGCYKKHVTVNFIFIVYL